MICLSCVHVIRNTNFIISFSVFFFFFQQYVKLKRHIRDIHKKTEKELEEIYSRAKFNFKGLSYQNCNLCGKGVRQMKIHLQRTHRLEADSEAYQTALGKNSERSRSVTQERKMRIQKKRESLHQIPVSVHDWIRYESRGDVPVDKKGMLRNIRMVLRILQNHSLTFTNLVEQDNVQRSYDILYKSLEETYKQHSINVILGHLQRFIDWACSEAGYPISRKVIKEQIYYKKLCKRRGNVQNIVRKAEQYIPTIEDLGPLILNAKHGDVIKGILEQPKETIKNHGIDLIHATLASANYTR
nr:MAG: hypothetical protein [Metapenaeopsis lamellata majanivirus]